LSGPLRIAHVMAGAPHGGAESFFERLCLAQHAAGDAVLPIVRRDAARITRLRAGGLAPIGYSFGSLLDLPTRFGIAHRLARHAPSVVVSWMSRATALTPRGPWVLAGRLGGYYDLKYYQKCDHLIGNTRGIVDWLRASGCAAGCTHYLPNFVADFADATPAADLPRGRPWLLALGRLHADKGFDLLLRALPRVPGVSLAIAGEGPEHGRLTMLARREGVADRVRFLGWRQDAGALLRAADLFVCSSRIEPLGNMVLEAWSAARPVVAAAAAGPAELITHDATGLLVPAEDPAALAAAIGALLDDRDRAQRLAAAGRARFVAEFAQAPVLARWRQFLTTVRAAE
jgi:glycosyltransferase involved in cell wall biosynthesis